MNIWGVIFVLPVVLLVILDPVETIPALAFFVVWIVFWLWVTNALIGPKPPRE